MVWWGLMWLVSVCWCGVCWIWIVVVRINRIVFWVWVIRNGWGIMCCLDVVCCCWLVWIMLSNFIGVVLYRVIVGDWCWICWWMLWLWWLWDICSRLVRCVMYGVCRMMLVWCYLYVWIWCVVCWWLGSCLVWRRLVYWVGYWWLVVMVYISLYSCWVVYVWYDWWWLLWLWWCVIWLIVWCDGLLVGFCWYGGRVGMGWCLFGMLICCWDFVWKILEWNCFKNLCGKYCWWYVL